MIQLIGVVCFTLIFATFSVWAIQHSRMLSAVHLAKLQMDFVASISHELRTPLAVICSAAENIADGVVEGKDQLARYGSIIKGQGRQITDLVEQILMFASTRDKKTGYVMRPLQVAQIVEIAVGSTAEVLHGAGFTLEQHVEPDLPLVMGDLQAFARCLKNLIVNAVKYSGSSRWISIRVFVERRAREAGREVCISVQDRGLGIDNAELPHVFEPFYRSPAVTSAQIHGTGLGLPLARSISEAMGARVSVESKLGVGSTFTLHLPIAREENVRRVAVAAGRDTVTK
jgi:signal transduction histidine kinase